MKMKHLCLLAAWANGNDKINTWATANYPNQPVKVVVPSNRWSGNSIDNVNFAPKKEKSPTDLRYFSKYASATIKAPGTQPAYQLPNADWYEKYEDEHKQVEVATNTTDADGNTIYTRTMHAYNSDYWEFAQTQTEKDAGWMRGIDSCGHHRGLRQQDDKNCPNVIIINTDDMAWADLSVNNPSKLVPTPNLDRLVSKGINFRDGHSCTARCAPSRYCFMTGRHHWRRGDYHYKPMYLEHGRKIMPQMFKRAGYKTYLIGKAQPTEAKITKLMSIDHYTQCKLTSKKGETFTEERRKRREADFQRLVYKGGDYVPAINDYMFMDVGENGHEMTAKDQKVIKVNVETTVYGKVRNSANRKHTTLISCAKHTGSRDTAEFRTLYGIRCNVFESKYGIGLL